MGRPHPVMEPQGGPYLDLSGVLSPLGAVRFFQLLLGCATISLVVHWGGYSATYGTFCMVTWCLCFSLSLLVLMLEVTRLHGCLRVSWDNLTATVAALAVLLCAVASVVYPLFSLGSGCFRGDCGPREFRIAAAACSCACCVSYGIEVRFARTRPGRPPPYMATTPGLLKVTQSFVAGFIFATLSCSSEYAHHAPALYCAAVYSLCLAVTVTAVVLAVSGKPAVLRLPFERFAAVCSLLAALLYVSAAVVWHVSCLEGRHSSPWRQGGCPRGSCPLDSRMAVAVFTYANVLLYVSDALSPGCRLRFPARLLGQMCLSSLGPRPVIPAQRVLGHVCHNRKS
uniref:Myeloid-associated differentiation marker-like protein 2 n=1 Tax=Scleropages formosus TaxID=113540 RepID=A0A8C9SCG3_SCLFO